MLTEINKTFRAEEDWIVIDLSPERDLLQSFAANLSNYPSLSEVFREAKINLSFLGLGVEIEGVSPITDLNVAVTRMLEKIKKKHNTGWHNVLPEFSQYLEEYVYSKIWSEMSDKDKEIMQQLAESGEIKVKDLREQLEMSSEQFSVYRERLKRKGVIDTRKYGKISMALPRFEEFIKMRMF